MDKKTKIRKGPLGLIGLVIVVIGIVTATTFSTIKDNLNLGLDLRGGFEILYEVEFTILVPLAGSRQSPEPLGPE